MNVGYTKILSIRNFSVLILLLYSLEPTRFLFENTKLSKKVSERSSFEITFSKKIRCAFLVIGVHQCCGDVLGMTLVLLPSSQRGARCVYIMLA